WQKLKSTQTPGMDRNYHQWVDLLPTVVTVICDIGESALAPCQWRSPALMCTTSPTVISRSSFSVATMPRPDVTTKIWSQSWVCHPVVAPSRKFTTLQRKLSDCPSPMIACRVRLTAPPFHPAMGVALSMGFSGKSLIFSTRMSRLLLLLSLLAYFDRFVRGEKPIGRFKLIASCQR